MQELTLGLKVRIDVVQAVDSLPQKAAITTKHALARDRQALRSVIMNTQEL